MPKKKASSKKVLSITERPPRVLDQEPVSRVEWRLRDNLKPNFYNPNRVAPPELELLIKSILEDGYTQPIVCLLDLTIVDGYHRYLTSDDARLRALYGGMVPVVRLSLDPVHRVMSTIRHNRARGTHAVLPMAQIVRQMLTDGVKPELIMEHLGMESEEVARLDDRAGMPDKVARQQTALGPGWIPKRGD